MSKTIRLRGIKEIPTSPTPNESIDQSVGRPAISIEAKGRVRLGVSRAAGEMVDLQGIEHDDIARVEYSNGFKLWTRVDDFYRENVVAASRSAVNGDEEVWEINPQPRNRRGERGAASVTIEALEFFGIDLKAESARNLSEWFERRQLHNDGPGLYQYPSIKDDAKLVRLADQKIPANNDNAILLFIHGTGSSSSGGFAGLWSGANPSAGDVRAALHKKYGRACYAFEHRTLTVSPIDNALEIAEALPKNAQLHLVTHSRGGLVGELLCLGQRERTLDPLQPELLDKIFDPEKDRTLGELFGLGFHKPEGYEDQKVKLLKLLDFLDGKNIKVTRFVRVACPARGTTLASGRLDRWLSILQYLSGGNDFVEFLLGVLKERTDPRTLPGLEAMMPGSALVRLLNYPELKVTADLTAIAGDIEGDSVWGKLKNQIADWFYDSDHDLVVNTGSMYGGMPRQAGFGRFFFDQGKDVNHFNYFKNIATVDKLKSALLGADSDLIGFEPISKAKHEKPKDRGRRRAPLSTGPLAIVLHGTMGTHLMQDNDLIWLEYRALSRGRLAELGITAPDVEPTALLPDYYGEFIDYLGASHRVEAFAYDWRLSVKDCAEKLAILVGNRLADCEARRQPIRFVAHSMGGLVVRVMFSLYPDLWRRFKAMPGSRFMMLGTPNTGSYEAVRWLTGWNPTLGKLTWLDVFHDTAGLVNIVNRYPGLLELLPADDGKRDYASPETWKRICAGSDEKWPLPQADQLQNLRSVWQLIKNSPIDSERMIYVAGWAPETVFDFENQSGRGLFTKERPPLRFYSTKKGDGTVPWIFGRLPGVKTWYAGEVAHDQLMAYSPVFPAYVDLLQEGTTTRLSQQEPATSRSAGDVDELELMPEVIADSMPSEEDLSGFVFGNGRPFKAVKRRLPQVNVSIRHGNLAYARHPICVGHYLGDTIVSAEADLNDRLEGALKKRLNLGLYPGELGSHAVFLHRDKNARPNGALIIGLGRVGELSPGSLTAGVSHALLDYALKISDWPDDRFGASGSTRSAKVSFLLIGSGFGGMHIRDSIESILTGVKLANDRLVESQFDDKVIIDDIEFLELYQDVAIKACREMEMIFSGGIFREHFIWSDHTLQAGSGGMQRLWFDDATDWWQRLEIVYDKKAQLLRYIALTDRARAEVTLVAGQMKLADKFIAGMVGSTSNTQQSGQTLFEMLIPGRLKELAPDRNDIVLIVDETSARYPWELLDDRWGHRGAAHEPLSVAAGMLRQLKTHQFRAKPLHAIERNAFVVGNPSISVIDPSKGSIFTDLPGAAREAESVAGLLSDEGYDVNKTLGKRSTNLVAEEILTGLHGEAYRILHLAGHGVHEFDISDYLSATENCEACGQGLPQQKKRVSGMVIGENMFLTPGDVEQMRWVPELVFINCCYLGSTEASHEEAGRFNELAANLGIQFINMGVKAVVAAGWAVDDLAAQAFAESFYQTLLNGGSFGVAVHTARRHIYQQFPDVNTWGAYQCYGDPDFRLAEDGSPDGKPEPLYHSRAEWVSDLANLLSAMHGSHKSKQEFEMWLKSLAQRVPAGQREHWQGQADVAVLLGNIHGELGDYQLAIEHLDTAMAADKAEFPVKALEHRANYRAKHALQFRRSADKTQAVQALDEINQAIAELTALNSMSETAERLCLLGSAYKLLAWMVSGKAKIKEALAPMGDSYRRAFEINKNRKADAYSLTNWGTAQAVLNWLGKTTDKHLPEDFEQWLNRAIDEARQRLAESPEYWDSLVEPNCLLTRALMAGVLETEESNRIGVLYRSAVERGASDKDKAALSEHLEFLIYMAEHAKKTELSRNLQGILGQLR